MGAHCQSIGMWASQTKSQHGGGEVMPTKEWSPQCTLYVLIDFKDKIIKNFKTATTEHLTPSAIPF